MGKHSKSFNVIGDALADYATLLFLFFRFIVDLVAGVVRRPRHEVRWPTGADEKWAEWLHEANESPSVRDEVRA